MMQPGENTELCVRSFGELSAEELYEIMALRQSVFVVEQNCPYQDMDGADREALHVFLRDGEGIKAYLRVLPAGAVFEDVSIGRVLSVLRRRGFASRLLDEGIRLARERFGAERIVIEAQTYARTLYEKAGFRQISEEFLEDGIPHIKMFLAL